MSILKIATIGHPVLRERAREVTRDELMRPEMQAFIDDLIETMREANGAGLAANQVHEPIRVVGIEVKDNPRYPYKPNYPLTILVNPVLEPIGDESFVNYEGCLSVPDLRGEVRRYAKVRVRAWDRRGVDLDFTVAGLTAGTFQHECDHIDGKLFVDRVEDTSTLTTWREFERHRKEAFVLRAKEIVARYGS